MVETNRLNRRDFGRTVALAAGALSGQAMAGSKAGGSPKLGLYHAPVIKDYRDMLRMIHEVDSPHLKACFDTRLEYGKKGGYLVQATREVGSLQVLTHYGDEYDLVNGKIVPKEDEFAVDQVAGLLGIGYNGFMGYELCHPLPEVNGQLPGIDYVDRNVELAARFMRDIIDAVKQRRLDVET